jgi:tetratricopeptide (TPR) repeat protein
VPLSGTLTNTSVGQVVEFVRVNTRVDLRLAAGLVGLESAFNREAFKAVPAFDLLCDALEPVGLSFRVENADPEIAEKSYFRMMMCYKKDDLMPQALENAMIILNRYPQSKRKKETCQTMLDIYKGLKNYGKVLEVLGDLAKTAADDEEKCRFEYEKGSIFFDMADYAQAAEIFKDVIGKASGAERIFAREAYARALMRLGNNSEALVQFQALEKEEPDQVRLFADKVLIYCLKLAMGKADEDDFPGDWAQYVRQYERLTDEARGQLSVMEITRIMWIYFGQAMIDIKMGRLAAAQVKLGAVATAPDDFLAADAGYRSGLLYLQAKDYAKAKEAFEYLLVFTKATESAVRANYALGQCLEVMGKPQQAAERYAQLLERYPLSPFVPLIKKNPVYQQYQNDPNRKTP